MVNLTIDPPAEVTQACVRRRLRFSSCRACADVCPAQAFSLAPGEARVDATRCIECGSCLFVCPTDAITGIKPVKRLVEDATLIGPFSLPPPTVDEQLLWHSQYGVRFIAVEAARSTPWLMALATVNLALRRYGEPCWSFRQVAQPEINASRRTLLHVARDAASPCSVTPGPRRLRAAFSAFSICTPEISLPACKMCGACWRSCPENALLRHDDALTIETARCTGCGSCIAVCPHQALRLRFAVEPAQTRRITVYSLTCQECKRLFHALTPEQTRCVFCQKHQGVRRF